MKSIDELQEFVNKQLEHYEYQLTKNNLRNRQLFEHLAENFAALKEHLLQETENSAPSSKRHSDFTTITPKDIEGLPPELLKELNISESDEAEFQIVNIIERHGGVMSLDHLIIALYRENGAIHQRRSLTAKLYRMTSKGLIFKGKRGTYSITPLEEGDDDDEEM